MPANAPRTNPPLSCIARWDGTGTGGSSSSRPAELCSPATARSSSGSWSGRKANPFTGRSPGAATPAGRAAPLYGTADDRVRLPTDPQLRLLVGVPELVGRGE